MKNAELSTFLFCSIRSRREVELHDLQRCVEEETRRHEAQLSELRIKHSSAIDNLQEQLDNSKRVRTTLQLHKQALFLNLCCPAGTTVPGEGQDNAGRREAEFDI